MTALAHAAMPYLRALQPAADAVPQPKLETVRVLHLDDSSLMGATFRYLTRNLDCLVDSVTDAQCALDLVATNPGSYRCIITDHEMPGMNGVEFVRALRYTTFRCDVFVLSSSVSPEFRREYQSLGVREILLKGSDTNRLSSLIQERL
jgi:CheY-like chemotaxis protein